MGRLTRTLRILSELEKPSCLFQRFLRGRILPLCDHQGIERLRDRDRQPAAGYFRLGCCDRFGGLGPFVIGTDQYVRCKILMHRGPFTVDVHTVIRDVSSVRGDSVALRADIFASEPELGQSRIPGLQAVFMSGLFVGQSR